jgi:5-methylcytosine-specific restriction protein A
MSKRKMPNTGWVDHNKLPKGPNGKALCRMCGEEVKGRRRSFCSDACVHQYKLRNQPRYVASQLYKRDRGKCCICGVDTYKVRRDYWKEWHDCKTKEEKKVLDERYKEAGWAPMKGRRYWEADHILPVAEGGGPNDWPKDQDYLCNFRTLCRPHHKEETKKLMERLRKKKNNEK